MLLLFLQNAGAKHGFQYLASQKLRLRRRLQAEHDSRHRYEQISELEQSQGSHQDVDNCLNLAQFSEICDCAKLLLVNNYPSYVNSIILHKCLIYTAPFIF